MSLARENWRSSRTTPYRADRSALSGVTAETRWLKRVARIAVACHLCAFAAVGAAADLVSWKGGETPALALSTVSGRALDLFRYRGRVVLVNFWATWCAPCREEIPAMQRLARQLSGRGFEILAVNLGEPPGTVTRFLRESPVEFEVLLDPGRRAAKSWGVIAVPSSYLIDSQGKIRYVALGNITWDDPHVSSKVAEMMPPP